MYCWLSQAQLLGIELRRRVAHVREVEPFDELLAGEHLGVAVRPAQAREVVDQRLGQVAVVAVLHDADRAVALGQALAVGAEDHRHVRELGQRSRPARGRC